MTKVTYIVSDIDKALAFEWIATHLNKEKFDLSFILLNSGNSQLETFLKEQKVPAKRIKFYKGWKMVFTFFTLWFYLLRTRPQIIHTHLRYASLLGITAGFLAGIKHRIHTRHHAAMNHDYYPHAVKQDKWVSRFSTKIVSVSKVVTDVMVTREQTSLSKIVGIPHGFDLALFHNPDMQIVEKLRLKYISDVTGPVIGVISRYVALKGLDFIIEAFKSARHTFPNLHLILANASGPDRFQIKSKLKTLPTGSFTEIIFEKELPALYPLFDVFVHAPVSKHAEAFGQTYVEALAAGVPSVFTLSGIANEFIVDRHNALVVPYKNSVAIKEAITEILENPDLGEKLSRNGKKDIVKFNLNDFIHRLETLYIT